MHYHRLGERCRCGHVTLPARFYWEMKGEKIVEVSQEKAEQAYLEHLKERMPKLYEKLRPVTPPVSEEPVTKTCYSCGGDYSGHGKECGRCRTKRSRSKP